MARITTPVQGIEHITTHVNHYVEFATDAQRAAFIDACAQVLLGRVRSRRFAFWRLSDTVGFMVTLDQHYDRGVYTGDPFITLVFERWWPKKRYGKTEQSVVMNASMSGELCAMLSSYPEILALDFKRRSALAWPEVG